MGRQRRRPVTSRKKVTHIVTVTPPFYPERSRMHCQKQHLKMFPEIGRKHSPFFTMRISEAPKQLNLDLLQKPLPQTMIHQKS